jgi:hypothetical protein
MSAQNIRGISGKRTNNTVPVMSRLSSLGSDY